MLVRVRGYSPEITYTRDVKKIQEPFVEIPFVEIPVEYKGRVRATPNTNTNTN